MSWTLRDAELAAATIRAQEAEEDLALHRLRAQLSDWLVSVGPDPDYPLVRVMSLPADPRSPHYVRRRR